MAGGFRFAPTKPLSMLSEALGSAAPNWAGREELEQLRYTDSEVPPETALGLGMPPLSALVEAYGEAISLQFLRGEEVILDLDGETNETSLEEFRRAVGDAAQVELRLQIDKKRLAQSWFGELFAKTGFPNRPILYLYPERLEHFLRNANLAQLEDHLWKNHREERITVLVPGQDCYVEGPHLLILGGQYLKEPQKEIFVDKRKPEERHAQVYQQCQDALKWQTQLDVTLTPWHLYIQKKQPGLEEAAAALQTHFTNLFLLYTADRTTSQTVGHGMQQYQASYSSPQQTIAVYLAQAGQMLPADLPQKNFEDLLRIFEWAYDSSNRETNWSPEDRLTILQVTIVDALRGIDRPQRYRLLIDNAPAILENTKWHWKAFAQDRVEKYWEQIRAMEAYLAETVRAHSERISGMVSKLTETMLAAVAVVLGSFIAALFKDKFNPTVFRIGLITYAFYVLFFPLLYNMRNQWEGYQITVKDFKAQMKSFSLRLPKGRADEILRGSMVDENAQRFKRWYWISVGIYVVLIVLSLVAAYFVPSAFTP